MTTSRTIMPPDAAIPGPEINFPITYENTGSQAANPDFTGAGTLTIKPQSQRYVFSGRLRQPLVTPESIRTEFSIDEIRNVSVFGRMISFHTFRGTAGEKGKPFVFYCVDPAEAQSVAALLPKVADPDFLEVRDFSLRLHTLQGASSPWTSVTNIIIGLNVAVFVIMGLLGAGWVSAENLMPYILYGANQGAATTDGEWWRLLTSMFMHYGILHLLLNMWALYQAGHFLEKLQGRSLYALTYLGSGLAGGFLSIAWHGDRSWSAGASGAVFGVYGAILGYLLREKHGLPKSIYQSLMRSSLTFAGYNIVYGVARSGTDNAAHVGGVAGGLALGWLFAMPVNRLVREQQFGRKLQLGIAAVLVLIIAGVGLTPRFDYSVREQLAFENANQSFSEQETALLKQNQTALQQIERGGETTAHAEWIVTHLVSFYSAWEKKIADLKLNPVKRTAKERDELRRILRLQIEAHTQLAAGLRAHTPGVLANYFQDEQNVARQIPISNRH